MSLYDDCEPKPVTQTWNSGFKLLESHLLLKKTANQTPPKKKPATTLAPVIDLQMKKKKSPTKSSLVVKNILPVLPKAYRSRFYLNMKYDWGYEDEYDPSFPCDYYKFRRELDHIREVRRKKKRDEEKARLAVEAEKERQEQEQLEKKKKLEAEQVTAVVESQAVSPTNSILATKNFLSNYGYDSDDCSGDEKDSNNQTNNANQRKGAEIAPPTSLTETDVVAKDPPVLNLRKIGEDVASKIMARYGFREGHGLGKDEQGMSTALQVQRTVRNCGRIIHENDLMPPPPSNSLPPRKSTELCTDETVLKNLSKVVLLCNMVGPGEVDNDLEREIKDECNTKYGEVVRVLIYERPNALNEDAVRVFVEFKHSECALKAFLDLNGRYFGGRTIKAKFYSLERYSAYQLND